MLVLVLLLCSSAACPTSGDTQSRFIEIDGRKEPGRIPQYYAWASVFRLLSRKALPSPRMAEAVNADLGISGKDLALVDAAAIEATKAQEQCDKHVADETTALRKQGIAVPSVRAVIDPIVLECRSKTLAAADALLAALSTENQNKLLNFLDRHKQSISISVRESELTFFRLPR